MNYQNNLISYKTIGDINVLAHNSRYCPVNIKYKYNKSFSGPRSNLSNVTAYIVNLIRYINEELTRQKLPKSGNSIHRNSQKCIQSLEISFRSLIFKKVLTK